jgi:HK97 family phage major capsid protein
VDRERSEWTTLAEQRTTGDALTERLNTALVRQSPHLALPQGITPVHEQLTDIWPDAGSYVSDLVTRSRNPEAGQRLDRAVANQLLADNAGLVPKPIVGPVITFVSTLRPLVSSVMNRPMPGAGASFSRPKVTAHTQVAQQTAEKTEVASRKMAITGTDVAKMTYGGTLDISFQNRDWTEPAILQIAIDDLAAEYAQQTDTGFATAFVAAVTQTSLYAPTATGADYLKAIAEASATIFQNTRMMPNTIWVSSDMWASLVGAVDGMGRPLFIADQPSNSGGQLSFATMSGTVFGLRLVADANLAAATMIVGVAQLAEFYEQIGGQLSVTEPTILGFVIAYYGYVAWLVVAPEAFVKCVAGP